MVDGGYSRRRERQRRRAPLPGNREDRSNKEGDGVLGVVSSEGAGAVGSGKMEAAGRMKGMVRGKSLQAEEAARLSRNSKAFLRAKVCIH